MAKFKRLFGVIIIMALLLMSSVPFVTQLATAHDGGGEPQETTPCESWGMGIEAVSIEGIELDENTSGLVSVGRVHMVLEDVVEISRAEPLEETVPLSPGWQNIMNEDFEGAFPNDWSIWIQSGSTDAYWGDDNYNPHWGSWSGFCADEGTAGVNPPSDYPNNMLTLMVYGPFSLTDATDAELNFYGWWKTQIFHDYFVYLASIDGTNWKGWEESGDSVGWQYRSFDLTNVPNLGDLCGQPDVWIAFLFMSDGSITNKGAFIDDIELRKYVGAASFDLEAVEVYLSTIPGDTEKTSVVGTPTVGQEVYFHFKWNCYGSGTTPSFRRELKLDGSMFCYIEGTAEGGSSYTFSCPSPWTATAGAHTLTGVLDVNGDIAESNEANNEAGKSWGGEPNWTFMVYLDGDNNLENAYIVNFNLMEYAANNTDVNVVVQFDRISGYDSSNGDWTTTRRYKVKYDTNLVDFASYTLGVDYWELGELNMADPNTLVDFVQWAKTNYPADHYFLAAVNHGGGWEPTVVQESTGVQELVPTGILWDDTSADYMSTADLGSALSSATSGGTEKLDVLFLDACLMQMIEVGYEIKGYADYMVASEIEGWAPGPYHAYISSITPTTTAPQLATTIVNEYHSHFAALGRPHTMSAVDLAQPGLAQEVDDFAQALTNGLPTYRTQIENSWSTSQKFDSECDLDIDNNDAYLDLYHFAYLIDQSIADAAIKSASQDMMAAVDAAVVAEAHESGSFWYGGSLYEWYLDNSHGISIYFPSSESDWCYSSYDSTNLAFVADKGWDEFLAAFFAPISYSLTISSTSGGSVTTPGEGTYGPYNPGDVVNLVAIAEPDYHFAGWTGDTSTIANPSAPSTNITMNDDYSITANFATGGEDWAVYMAVITEPDIGSVPGVGSYFGFGARDGASDGYNSGEGDEIAPMDPIAGINAYFYYPSNPQFQRNLIMSVSGPAASITWPLVVKMKGETGDADMTISWPDISGVPAKYVVLELQDTGGTTLADMRSVDHYTFYASQETTYSFKIVALENAPPEVSNVSATQRSDGSGIVDISYDVSDNEQSTVDIALEYWHGSWHSCTNTAGDVGSGINTGMGKAATWDPKAQLGAAYMSGCKVRVTAEDGATGSDGEESNTFDLDTAPPTGYGCASPADETECVSVDEALVCSTASDDSTPIEYKFAIASDEAFSQDLQESGWQQSTSWTPTTALPYSKAYWWRMKARDAKNNEGAWSSPFTFVTICKFDLALKSGWNMISLPLESCTGETDPDVILPDVEVIYIWNCETMSYDSPSEIVPGKGYWALVFEDVTETVYGTPVEEYQLSSDCEGWHMVGALYVDGQVNVGSGSVYGSLYHWNPETLNYIARPLDDIRPGEGYWLLAFADFSISIVPKPPAP